MMLSISNIQTSRKYVFSFIRREALAVQAFLGLIPLQRRVCSIY